MKRNAVLTFASGYPLSVIEPFVASFVEHVDSAELVLFTTGSDDALYAVAAEHGITVLEPATIRDYPLVIARNFVYRDFLQRQHRNFDAVLLSDSRDVVFQADPFARPRGRPVTVATEDNTLEGCPWNRWWMQMVYGEEVRARIGHMPICCAGTTIGTTDGMLRYLDLICHEADHRDRENGEQCYHNYICYELQPDFIEVDQGDAIVQTIGQADLSRVRFEADGRLLVDGGLAPVVHQYDRHPALAAQVRSRHRLAPRTAAGHAS